jgi:hypothetical protein
MLGAAAPAADETPQRRQALTAPLLAIQGKPYGHEPTYPKGPVNQRIAGIERRTQQIYGKQK